MMLSSRSDGGAVSKQILLESKRRGKITSQRSEGMPAGFWTVTQEETAGGRARGRGGRSAISPISVQIISQFKSANRTVCPTVVTLYYTSTSNVSARRAQTF